ncbi:MAG: hypothetical protein WD847_07960 [Pirellulales bacterium]
MVQLSHEQQQELSQHGDKPLGVVDPATGKLYYIIAGELYDRLWTLLGDDEFDIRETYAAQDAGLAKVWDDPELDVYNDYDAHKPQ